MSLSLISLFVTTQQYSKNIMDKKDFRTTGVVAMQRKVLGLLYTLWKKNTEYIENYKDMKVA